MRTLPARYGMTNNQTIIIIIAVCVFGFIGLVVLVGGALLFPAVGQAREAARRAQCKNNLKQLGLALHNYHDVFQTFPPGYVYREKMNNYGWSAQILPYLEQAPLHSRMDFNGPWDPILGSQMNPVFLCPSDPRSPVGMGGMTRSCYPGSHGSEELREDVETASGIFYRNSKTPINDILDGTSNTILAGERCRSRNGYPSHPGLWIGYRQEFGPVDVLFRSPKDAGDGNVLINAGDGSGLSSDHEGGAHVLMCDGAVTLLNQSIDPKALHGLSTRKGGEQVTAF